jgi:alpha-mannosidase
LEAPGAQCKGPHEFEYAFTSYQGAHAEAGIVGQAHAYAFSATAITTNQHRGKIKSGSSLVGADNPNIVVSAVETSGRKGAWAVRLYNASSEQQETSLSVWSKRAEIYEVNLLERKRSKEPLKKKAGRVRLNFRPSEIKTLKVFPKQ